MQFATMLDTLGAGIARIGGRDVQTLFIHLALFLHSKDELLAAFLAGDQCVSVVHAYSLRCENGCCLPPHEQDLVGYLGTLRTDLGLVGAGFFFDLDGADFIGAGVSAFFFVVVVLLFDERLLVVFLVTPVLLALLRE